MQTFNQPTCCLFWLCALPLCVLLPLWHREGQLQIQPMLFAWIDYFHFFKSPYVCEDFFFFKGTCHISNSTLLRLKRNLLAYKQWSSNLGWPSFMPEVVSRTSWCHQQPVFFHHHQVLLFSVWSFVVRWAPGTVEQRWSAAAQLWGIRIGV